MPLSFLVAPNDADGGGAEPCPGLAQGLALSLARTICSYYSYQPPPSPFNRFPPLIRGPIPQKGTFDCN